MKKRYIGQHVGEVEVKYNEIRVPAAGGKCRQIKARDQQITLRRYSTNCLGKIEAALIITNDFDISMEKIVRKYAHSKALNGD
jgi:hypothetical protein